MALEVHGLESGRKEDLFTHPRVLVRGDLYSGDRHCLDSVSAQHKLFNERQY